jgi:Mrp family chromosome partitioning ATPase/capsular polysaccharide biosynthesis protein
MNPQVAPDYFELSDYTGVLRRHWRRIAACALAGLALAAAYVVVGPRTYTATVLVQVNALPNNANALGGRTGGPVNMDNEAQSVRSLAVAQIVKSRLHSQQSAADIAQNIRATVPPNSTYLQISCARPTATEAAKCANAAGRAYLYNRRVNIMNLLGTGITALQAEAQRLRDKIEQYKILLLTARHKQQNLVSGTPKQIGNELQLSAARSALASIQAHINATKPLYTNVAVKDSTIVGLIASPATVPTSPSSPRKLLFLPSGLIAGLVLGLAWAFGGERRDKRVHSVRDVERLGNLPTLLSLASKPHGKVTGIDSPRSPAGRAFSEVARYVDASLGEGSHVLAVAATSPGSNGSVVAVNLAAALARTTDRTVLVCADLYGTRAPELLGIPRGRGLSEVLTGASRVSEVANPAGDLPRLRLITPGLDASRALLAMQQAKLKRLISDALDEARYVVVEVQPLGESSDTFGLAQFADAAIVAVEVEQSRPADIADCVRRLGLLGTPVLGTTILRRVRLSSRPVRQADAAVRVPQASSASRHETELDQVSSGQNAGTGPSVWTPGTPKVSGETAGRTATSAPHGLGETMPMPRVTPTERDRYPSPADPATGD